MTTYFTKNPLGSSSPYDLFDNAQNFDTAVNSITAAIWQDRFGKNRLTWHGIESLATQSMLNYGYITAKSFEQGYTLLTPNTVLQLESDGEYYRWDGDWTQPKVVPPGSTPESAGGVGPGKWVGVGDASLRSDLKKPSGAGDIGEVSGGTVQDKLDELASADNSDIKSLYRYKIARILALKPPLIASITAAHGYSYMYPQSYCYGKNGDVWINMSSNTSATWAVKYDSTGQAVSAFKVLDGVSELSRFYTEGGQDYYVIGAFSTLKRYNVTSLPAGESVQTPTSTWTPDCLFAGCGFLDNKRVLLEERTTPIGSLNRRFRMFVFNMDTGLRESSFAVPLQITGSLAGDIEPYQHKSQGIAATGRGLFLSHGKNSTGTEKDTAHGTGVSLMNWGGGVEATALITADGFRRFMISQGYPANRCENEGIDIVNGYPHILNTYIKSTNDPHVAVGGIALISIGEPFGSVDLSADAVPMNVGQYYGKSKEGYYNPYTGQVMDSIKKMMDYMSSCDLQTFSFYTSGYSITDLDGTIFAPSQMVEIFNPNNFTFWYRVTGIKTQNLYYTSDRVTKNYASFIGNGKTEIQQTQSQGLRRQIA
ncbi:hypothetical protein HV079_10760 [Citrobacter freundii]|uniref:tail fiber/spike domain-containing protein n=1 Tax=Citrobacter freundii TaxID=546 RepID=UPI0015E9F876|nr:hypothetical protein [Citrobacter freundii]QLZ59594.1 hypothetical protein HV079_10760 [Citrobacter freundii]